MGKHLWELCDPADPNIKEFKTIDGKEADEIIKINSEYPADGFWWDSQLRIIPGLLGGIHFMEPFVHAVAELDALRITSGGLFCNKGAYSPITGICPKFHSVASNKVSKCWKFHRSCSS